MCTCMCACECVHVLCEYESIQGSLCGLAWMEVAWGQGYEGELVDYPMQ